MTRVQACPVPPGALTVLPGVDYSDAYEAEFPGHKPALALTREVFSRSPRWMAPLMGLRNFLVRPFGLQAAVPKDGDGQSMVGFFPIQSATPKRAVLGFDDKHLDFRLVADAEPLANGNTRFVVSTVIRRHNALGHAYLALVLPFHRFIVPAFLGRETAP